MYIILHPNLKLKPVKYIIKTIFEDFLGLNYKLATTKDYALDKKLANELTLYYGPEDSEIEKYCQLIIYSNDFWSDEFYLKKKSLPKTPLQRYKGKELPKIINENNLPVIYSSLDSSPYIIKESENKIKTNIDIFTSIFYMLTGYEEVLNNFKDLHNRYPGTKSLAYKEGFLDRPIVNEYIEILWFLISSVDSTLERKKHNYKLIVTHDVDQIKVGNLNYRLRYIISELYRKKSIRGFCKRLAQNIKWLFTFPKNTFKFIDKMSRKYHFKSHFFYLVNGSGDSYDRLRYDINSKKIVQTIYFLEKRGHKIGLHCSYNSFLDKKKILNEKEKLSKITKKNNFGARSHYLRFKIPESFRILEECKFKYDSTLYYAEHDGFRSGTCYPFHPYDIENDLEFSLLEYPLILMEGTLLNKQYRGLKKPEEVLNVIKQRIDKISFFKGNFVFLIHNHAFEDLTFPWRKVFKKMLKYNKEIVEKID